MTSTTRGGRRILGSLGAAEGKGVVRMEDRFDTDIDDLWSAITDPGRLARWLGTVEGDLRLGGEFHAHYYASGWEGTGRIEVCEPPHRLLVEVKDETSRGEGTVEVVLIPAGHGTMLVWEECGMPVEHLAAYGAGIQIHVEDLADHIAGHERRADVTPRWEELETVYAPLAADVS
jgi:uncharacterized protein YndB with AHSA1/START domain